ncbi:MAG: NAD(P)H-hydrate dehydratase [Alphaproteobacteria bacterium]|nr:NAD(P)H-hydrate dehydratase [Alphaproteobacteria bacterium]
MLFPVCTPSAIRALDAHNIETLGVPSLCLMEAAARGACQALIEHAPRALAQGVEILAGRGNNGGDGYAMARLLHLSGVKVRVLGLAGEHTRDCAAMRRAAASAGVPIDEARDVDLEAGALVDALLGTGLTQPLRGRVAELVAQAKGFKGPVLAVDMPTGLCGETGRVLGDALPASMTVTFAHPRLGQLLEPGADLVGELVVVDIGLIGEPSEVVAWLPTGAWVAERLPKRAEASHKGSHGHLAIVAGSAEMAGAAVLACMGARASGCGLITLFIAPEAMPRLGSLPPEVMLRLSETVAPEQLACFSAAAVGPGLGRGRDAEVQRLWDELARPAVFDADGLNALNGRASAHPRAITPHPGEAGRLLGLDSKAVQADRVAAVRALAGVAPALLKGRHTLVHDGSTLTVNRTGTAAMATAGAGDVLTGLVGGLLARGLTPGDALRCGAFLHGFAGELAGLAPIAAGDIAETLPEATRRVADYAGVLERRPLLAGLGV